MLSKRLLELEVFTFLEAVQFVKNLPYGRTADRANPDLVLKELKGTCSTKHAVLKKVAIEQELSNVKLYLCMFKMSGSNIPLLANVLDKHQVAYVPEAHCVLQIDNNFIDVTNATSNYDNLINDVLELIEIQPEQIGSFKVAYHQAYLKKWLKGTNSEYLFEEFWDIREECIATLCE
ncbi:MAG: hypothetical protein COA88_05225 [Kordia sp.]|nr:MAG: hypothetical protein COA88_05225 [Kordia sp.]